METSGGYAREVSDDYKKQAEMMQDALKKNDIVICTALYLENLHQEFYLNN